MSEITPFDSDSYYLGLPVLTFDEYSELSTRLSNTDLIIPSIRQLGQSVIKESGYIDQIIEQDTNLFLSDPSNEGCSREERRELVAGIIDGYEWLIGCFTWVSLHRLNRPSLEGLPMDEQINLIPVLTESEKDRILQVRAGKAYVDYGDPIAKDGIQPDVISSDELAYRDMREYTAESVLMSDLQFHEVAKLRLQVADAFNLSDQDELDEHDDIDTTVTEVEIVESYIAGFDQGVASAIEMYIQGKESRLLNFQVWALGE